MTILSDVVNQITPVIRRTSAFATPAVLAANPQANDLESVLTHELGHFFGFEHSAAWSAMMFPFVPPGSFHSPRPTLQTTGAPLADDDRSGLRDFAPRFFQTSPHGSALAFRYHFTSIWL
jgi:hypothetical protein